MIELQIVRTTAMLAFSAQRGDDEVPALVVKTLFGLPGFVVSTSLHSTHFSDILKTRVDIWHIECCANTRILILEILL